MKPKYKCQKCKFVWEENKLGPVFNHGKDLCGCPKCCYLYLDWINFKDMFPDYGLENFDEDLH